MLTLFEIWELRYLKSNKTYIITIDGTSSSGKSTISKMLAHSLKFNLLDSGKLYRAVAYAAKHTGKSIKNIDNYNLLISDIKLESNTNTNNNEIIFKNKKIDHMLYDEEIGEIASKVSKIPIVRECMYQIQHSCIQGSGLIANGRDMGSEVFPNANLKLFIDASLDVRAKRRFEELSSKGHDVVYETIYQSLQKRDESDMNRSISPLKVPDNAVIIDTSDEKPVAIVDKIKFV